MENKSKELAKLLNIKPKYRGSRWEFKDRIYFANSKIFDTKEEAEEYNNDEEFSVEELNVDFKNPINFIKLWEMPDILIGSADFESYIQKDYIGNLSLAVQYFGFEHYDRESFIDCLILMITEWYFEDLNAVKQQAQKIGWKYE